MIQTYQIEFKEHRCSECGTFWAVETSKDFRNDGLCPRCQWLKNRKQAELIEHSDRVIAGLKGVIKRLK